MGRLDEYVYHFSGFWFSACHAANINGNYPTSADCAVSYAQGIIYNGWKGLYYSALESKLMARPQDYDDCLLGTPVSVPLH